LTYLSGLFAVLFIFSSCEKVIEFDLSGSREMIVIEATITNDGRPFTVLVSKTSPYFETEKNNKVSEAKVSVRIENGKPKYFKETSPGVYKLENNLATVGHLYAIDVECDSVTYSARSLVNEAVPIVELGFTYFDGFEFFDTGYKVITYVRDPADRENYYRLKYYVNGRPIDHKGEISLYSDKLFNGKVIGLGQHSAVFEETDTITVELQTIDKAVFEYFSTLESISGNQIFQTASPANPIGNFNNGALGYFSAYTYDRRTVIIKDYLKK